MSGWRDVTADVLAIAGAGLIAYGAWLIYPPAAFILGGAGLIGAATLLLRRT